MACIYQYKNQQFKTKQELLNFMANEYNNLSQELYNSQFQEEQIGKTIDENPFRSMIYRYIQAESTIPIKMGKLMDLSNNNNLATVERIAKQLNAKYESYDIGAIIDIKALYQKAPRIKFYDNNMKKLHEQDWFTGKLTDEPQEIICK